MSSLKVSIIVPCYNQAYYLNQSLQSVLDQTIPDWECIIVNDGSPDATEVEALKWCRRDPRFRYLKKNNGGLSSARNAGIAISKGNFILPLDADDLLHYNYLEHTMSFLENDPSLAVVSSYSNFFVGNKDHIIHIFKPKGDNYRHLLYVNQLVATSLYRKECWKQVGGYDESMKKGFEDWEFWLAITKTGWRYKIVEKPLFYYRKADQSMLTRTIQNHAESIKEYIIHKHREVYIADFDNCIRVMTHDLKVHRKKAQRLAQSNQYKVGKMLFYPWRWLERQFNSGVKKLQS